MIELDIVYLHLNIISIQKSFNSRFGDLACYNDIPLIREEGASQRALANFKNYSSRKEPFGQPVEEAGAERLLIRTSALQQHFNNPTQSIALPNNPKYHSSQFINTTLGMQSSAELLQAAPDGAFPTAKRKSLTSTVALINQISEARHNTDIRQICDGPHIPVLLDVPGEIQNIIFELLDPVRY
ncbi:hypothetical protein G7Y89_g14369 [Cudoniella acicularis]|uniref:Uncharacterized protein n=1 Tax=Cudoniella acicularis TaxID=354080 RepID=A0A8H4R6K7_9HELO|nr:hypothetical protein G7Y89_g14369 [Cudoniella acicularis]